MLITGATSGIGLHAAKQLARGGARVLVQGHERTWALDHLAPFLLAHLLRPARVVIVSSAAHRRARIAWDAPSALAG